MVDNQIPVKGPGTIKAQLEAELKETKIKGFKQELKKLLEEAIAAENVALAKKKVVEDFMESGADLFN